MFFIRVKSIKRINIIKRQDVRKTKNNKNNNSAHKTTKKKKITIRIKRLRGRKLLCA